MFLKEQMNDVTYTDTTRKKKLEKWNPEKFYGAIGK